MSQEPMLKDQDTPTPAPEMPSQPPGSVDQIRDILFGQQMSEYDARFQQLEKRLIQENNALADRLNRRIDEALSELANERQERATAFNDLLNKLTAQHEQLESAQSFSERQLLDQLGTATEQIAQQMTAVSEKETRRHGRIRSLFKELAENLDQEPQ